MRGGGGIIRVCADTANIDAQFLSPCVETCALDSRDEKRATVNSFSFLSFPFLFSSLLSLSLSLSGNSIRDTGSKTVSRKCRGRRNRRGEGGGKIREGGLKGVSRSQRSGGGTPCDLEEHGVVYKAKGKHR